MCRLMSQLMVRDAVMVMPGSTRERPLAGLVSGLLSVTRAGSGRAKEGQHCEHTAVVLG